MKKNKKFNESGIFGKQSKRYNENDCVQSVQNGLGCHKIFNGGQEEKKGIDILPSFEQLESMMLERNTPFVNAKLKKAKVAIAGLGGLGSNIAINLARAGVGFVHLIDFDIVEPSNLNRQQYRICHLGMTKADALKQEIGEINPFVTVSSECIRITPENAVGIFKNDDIICEAFDDPVAKAMLVNTLLKECPDKMLIAASGLAGHGSSNDIRTRRILNNFYICGDGKSEISLNAGLMAPRVAICAGHQANMVLRLILEEKEV